MAAGLRAIAKAPENPPEPTIGAPVLDPTVHVRQFAANRPLRSEMSVIGTSTKAAYIIGVGKRVSTVSTNVALALGAGVFFALSHYFAHYPLTGAGAVFVGLLSVVALRAMVRSKLISNPGGSGERDFALKPVVTELLRASGCIIAGFTLIILGALAVRYRFMPDSFLTALFTVFPGLIVALLGVWFLIRANYKAVCGVVKR